MTPVEVLLGDVGPGDIVGAPDAIPLHLSADMPGDPYGVALEITLSWEDAPARILGAEIGVGTRLGRADDFEDPSHGWTAGPVRPSSFSQWTYGPHHGEGGSAGFRHGYVYGYRRGCDGVLVSPPILLPPRASLVFRQRVDISQPDPREILAGGVVEISVNGADWQPATPAGGYPARFSGQNPDWDGRPMYSGFLHNGTFFEERVDLSAFRGSVRVRFRFYSEREVSTGSGWAIDNVRVESGVTPVRILSVEPRVDGNDVVLAWRLAEPLPAAVRWLRGDEGVLAVVGAGWVPAADAGEERDVGGAGRLPASYWLEGRERDGTVSRHGPWAVAPGSGAFSWRVLANPARGVFTFASSPLPPGADLAVFDVRGARVRRVDSPAGATQLSWDGRDDAGRTVPPGIYFARLRGPGAAPIRLVRLP
jgi:hypothetical protein